MGSLNKTMLVLAVCLLVAATARADYDAAFDYSKLGLNEVDAQGFLHYQDADASFDYRASVYLPQEAAVVGLGPWSPSLTARLEVKNLHGKLALARLADFRFGNETKPLLAFGNYLFTDQNASAFQAEYELPVTSLFGEAFGGMKFYGPFLANGQRLDSFTAYLPKETKTVFLKDTGNPSSVFPLGLHSAFYFNPVQAVFAYELPGQAPLYRFLFLAAALLLGVAAAGLRAGADQEEDRRAGKDGGLLRACLLGFAVALLLSQQLAFAAGEHPQAPVALDESSALEELPHIIRSEGTSFHLLYALANADAVGPVVLGFTMRCGQDYGYLYPLYRALARAARGLYLVGETLPGPCAKEFLQSFGGKAPQLLGIEQASALLERVPDPTSPWRETLYKLIVLLANLAAFFGGAALVMAGLSARTGQPTNIVHAARHHPHWGHRLTHKLGKWLDDHDHGVKRLAAVALACSIVYALAVQLTGFIARLPVTYHGGNGLGYTMASRFLPGLLGEGHSLTFFAALLGCLGAAGLARKKPNPLNPRIVLAAAAVLFFLMALPQTSYAVKRNLASLACAECLRDEGGDGLSAALVKLVAPLSQGKAWELAAGARGTDAETGQFFADIGRLRYQGKREEALALLREFAANHAGQESEGTAYYEIGSIAQGLGRSREAVENFSLVEEKFPKHPKAASALYSGGTIALSLKDYAQAAEMLEKLVNGFPDNAFRPAGLYYLGLAYQGLGENEKAGQAFRELTQKYPKNAMADAARKQVGG